MTQPVLLTIAVFVLLLAVLFLLRNSLLAALRSAVTEKWWVLPSCEHWKNKKKQGNIRFV